MSLIGAINTATLRQRGLSLVELMVGITIGLFIVAAAVTLTSNQLVDNRRLLLELQIQQDLRATMDIMTRQLRRAGAFMPGSQLYISLDGLGGLKSINSAVTPAAAIDSQTVFRFVRNPDEDGPFGFRLDATNGVVITDVGENNFQELTDRSTMRVRELVFDSRGTFVGDPLPCPKLCPPPGGATDCWPRMVMQRMIISITAEARNDPTIRRTLSSEVRVRNDWVRDNVPAPSNKFCPA
jgi:type II secretory pathway pseudopilin PulG